MSNYNFFILLIVAGVIVLAALGAATFLGWQYMRTRRLREQFGPEYDRTVKRAGGRKAAEAELMERRRRHAELNLRSLDPAELSEFKLRWSDMQQEFVDDPTHAVSNADRLVIDVMSARGYPTDDLDKGADDLSVDHPHIAQDFRDARKFAGADKRGKSSTEDLRQALTSYRALLEDLLSENKSRDVDLSGKRRGSRGNGRRGGTGRADDHRRDSDRVDGRVDEHRRDSDRLDSRSDDRTRESDRIDDRHPDADRRDGTRQARMSDRETRA